MQCQINKNSENYFFTSFYGKWKSMKDRMSALSQGGMELFIILTLGVEREQM